MTKICIKCGKPAIGRSLCRAHYQQWWITKPKEQILHTFEERFWAKVNKTDSCWLWLGDTNTAGYGTVSIGRHENRRRIGAHRVSYELIIGKIPEGKILLHSCDNPPCVNPDHLKPGTHADNYYDSRYKRRHAFGERHGHAKLTKAQTNEIKTANGTNREIAIQFGINPCTVSRIKTGKRRSLG